MNTLFACRTILVLIGCALGQLCAQAEAISTDSQASAASKSTIGDRLFVVPDVYSSGDGRSDLSLQREQAESFFQRARAECEDGNVGGALQWATRAVNADPDHEGARRVLGHRRVEGQWGGSYAARRLERGEVWHDKYGWIQKADVPRFEAGERRLGKRWISAEEDRRRHAKIDDGWQIRTDHFRVVTDHSREDAGRLATRLEMLYQIWQQQFGGFYLDAPKLLRRFDGDESSGYRRKPFHVIYYRTQDEYNAALRRQQPRIAITLGIYFESTRSTHFFAGSEQDSGTIYHEAVHQLFQESTKSARHVGALANGWIVEGVACYFESLLEHDDDKRSRYFTLGGASAGRLPAARHRRLVDEYYLPLAALSELGLGDLQQRPDVARLYSQSAGLTTFLMQAREGAYRPALVELLKLIYAGRDEPTSLVELTGRSFRQLDDEYADYLQALP